MNFLVVVVLLATLLSRSSGDSSKESSSKLTFKPDGTFKILHLSDVHYRIGPDQPCRDVTKAQEPYCQDGAKNTTDFIRRLIETEKPDLVAHTGDIIDGDTHTASQGMEDLYGVSFSAGLPWAATIGNHDEQSDLTREQLMDYILTLPLGVSELNALGQGPTESFGNFYLEIFPDADAPSPSFRTFHLDANTNNVSINADQVNWFSQKASELSAVHAAPAMAFFHIPLEEYMHAGRHEKVSGIFHEPVSYNGQTGLFDAILEEGSVKATFVGHDHTNDWCANWKGVQLCYEGSPGYQGYSGCTFGNCLKRTARVTEISAFGQQVRSWKRKALETYPETEVVDVETLWAADSIDEASKKREGDCERHYAGLADDEAYAALRSNRASHYASLGHKVK